MIVLFVFFFFSSRRRHTRCLSDWSSDVCSSDLVITFGSPQSNYYVVINGGVGPAGPTGATGPTGGGGGALSAITAAAGTNSIANGDNAQLWNWATTTSGRVGIVFGETTASTSAGVPYDVQVSTLAGSTATPLNVTNSLNGSQTLPALSITPAWNTTGVVDAALLVNATNTASGAASKLLDLQIGGSTQFNVDKTGLTTALGGVATGSGPPACVVGTAGALCQGEGTAPTRS